MLAHLSCWHSSPRQPPISTTMLLSVSVPVSQDQMQLPFMPRPPLVPTGDRTSMLRAGSTGQIPFPLAGGGGIPGAVGPTPSGPMGMTNMQRATSMVTSTAGLSGLSAADLGLGDLDLNLP